MLSARTTTRLCSPQAATRLTRASAALGTSSAGLGAAFVRQSLVVAPRHFSTTPPSRLRDFFPAKETPQIRMTTPAWPHPGYTEEDMLNVVPGHRKPETWGDWAAWKLVRFARYCMDKATGMNAAQQVDKKNPTTAVVAEKPLTEAQWVSVLRSRRSATYQTLTPLTSS